jgi:hypothetical protein
MFFRNTVKFVQVAFGLIPEMFDAIDAILTIGKELGVVDPHMSKAGNIRGIVAGRLEKRAALIHALRG